MPEAPHPHRVRVLPARGPRRSGDTDRTVAEERRPVLAAAARRALVPRAAQNEHGTPVVTAAVRSHIAHSPDHAVAPEPPGDAALKAGGGSDGGGSSATARARAGARVHSGAVGHIGTASTGRPGSSVVPGTWTWGRRREGEAET
ncbi:hypothetical protein ACIHAA_03485 [Streptomyces sp. NPDC052040]|uniref:hypothetical protein n=1 Tax=Streptomyces sp. NPDC052040 TaxID=3365682 RepID=UPI0037D21FDC